MKTENKVENVDGICSSKTTCSLPQFPFRYIVCNFPLMLEYILYMECYVGWPRCRVICNESGGGRRIILSRFVCFVCFDKLSGSRQLL